MITRVPHGALRSRIDSGFYAPNHLERERRLRQLGVMRIAIGEMASLVTDGTHKTPNYVESGVPFLSATNISNSALTFTDHKFVSRAEFLQLRAWNCAPLPNDVVVAKSGSIGNAAVVPSHAPEFAVFESVAIVRCDRFDPYYLGTFLNSRIGQEEIKRQTKGAVIRHLHLEDLREVEVPEFSKEAQLYIGDKVRQAERLRERARNLEFAARASTIDLVRGPSTASEAAKNLERAISGKQARPLEPVQGSPGRPGVLRSRVRPSAMFGRLNAEAYQQDYLDNDRALLASGWRLTRLADLVTAPINNSIRGVTEHLSPDSRGVPMFRPADIDGLWMNDSSAPRISAAFEQQHAKARVEPGDIVLAIAGTVAAVGRIGESVAFGNINGSSARVRVETPLRGFVLLFLASDFGQRELMRWAVGSVQKHLNLEDLTEVRVPEIPLELCAPFESALQLSGRAHDGSKALVEAGTALVELLIEGRVSEADLVAAQKGLEAGDLRADREILKALRQCGAHDGRPLVADVDALHALLDELGGQDA